MPARFSLKEKRTLITHTGGQSNFGIALPDRLQSFGSDCTNARNAGTLFSLISELSVAGLGIFSMKLRTFFACPKE